MPTSWWWLKDRNRKGRCLGFSKSRNTRCHNYAGYKGQLCRVHWEMQQRAKSELDGTRRCEWCGAANELAKKRFKNPMCVDCYNLMGKPQHEPAAIFRTALLTRVFK